MQQDATKSYISTDAFDKAKEAAIIDPAISAPSDWSITTYISKIDFGNLSKMTAGESACCNIELISNSFDVYKYII